MLAPWITAIQLLTSTGTIPAQILGQRPDILFQRKGILAGK